MAEVGVIGAAGQDQGPVAERERTGTGGGKALHHEFAALAIQPGYLAHHDRDVALPAQDVTERDGDIARRQTACGHLVGQGLEEEIVVTVHERHFDAGPGQFLHGFQAAKATAHDDDGAVRVGGAHLPR